MTTLLSRTQRVQERIEKAALAAGRSPAEITLVAVTKTWPAATLLEAYDLGLRHFGENRPEELADKRQAVTAHLGADSGIIWHQIGTVQSRKSGLVAAAADYFHALDRIKIANRLSRDLVAAGRQLPVLLEVNVSGEASKAGFDCTHWEDDQTQRDAFRAAILEICELPGLVLSGLMTMAPWDIPPAEIQDVFARTQGLQRWLGTNVPSVSWSALSMGMTDDFELAIAAGATHVRVGRAIFGERA